MKTIQIDRDVFNYLTSKAVKPGEPPLIILKRELQLSKQTEAVEVDDETYNYLLSKTVNLGESTSEILRRELKLEGESHTDPSAVIVFHIPPGTGAQSWNTRERIVVAAVGNTLRVVNDDSVPHRPHTNGVPFPHPSADILPGQAADFLLQAPFDPNTSGPLQDHAAGPSAQFWIMVR
ncbi:MAG: SeqA protein N-terminal domain [Thermoanaerobaculia bacterium]|nr:SeqA protein N-terminal domain [Thermoanaerobaculia bacterium]